jgi:hypothetical protein
VSGRVIPLKRPQPASPEPPSPWILGEVFSRDGVDYELFTAGEIKFVELGCGEGAAEKAPCDVLNLPHDAGALVGDHVLVLRRTRPA